MVPVRRYPKLVAGRATSAEHAMVKAAAELDGKSINDFVRATVIEGARRRLAEETSEKTAES